MSGLVIVGGVALVVGLAFAGSAWSSRRRDRAESELFLLRSSLEIAETASRLLREPPAADALDWYHFKREAASFQENIGGGWPSQAYLAPVAEVARSVAATADPAADVRALARAAAEAASLAASQSALFAARAEALHLAMSARQHADSPSGMVTSVQASNFKLAIGLANWARELMDNAPKVRERWTWVAEAARKRAG